MLKLQHKNSDRSIWLVGPKMKVGANKDNEVLVTGDGVADFHAELYVEGDTVAVAPIGGNPCLVNGQAIAARTPLKVGDEVTVGSREFVIVPPKQGTKPSSPVKEAPDDANATVMRKVAKIEPSGKGTGWMLQATHQSLGNKRYAVNGKVVVGRAQECELSFSYDRLSRRHAELKLVNGALLVKDLESSNGTFVNGKRVDSVRLQPGDTLSFDKLSFTVVGPSEPDTKLGFSDELNKTVIRPAIDPAAVNRALKQSNSTAQSTGEKSKAKSSNNTMIIAIVVVVVIAAAVFFLV
jgi:pSer/pThr/pTyr-binding forkhead associated (FHA) protein